MINLPKTLLDFVDSTAWVFAKTYAKTWPHEYIVREQVDEDRFVELVRHIRNHGYLGKFYAKDITYLDCTNLVYWTMGASIEETTVINRCRKEQSYEYRLAHNDLPN